MQATEAHFQIAMYKYEKCKEHSDKELIKARQDQVLKLLKIVKEVAREFGLPKTAWVDTSEKECLENFELDGEDCVSLGGIGRKIGKLFK